MVDRAKPLDQYVLLDPSDPLAARFLLAAFNGATLSDDQKLSLLSEAGARTSDVFARREMASKELPGIDARLARTRETRYLRIEAADPVYLQRLARAARGLAVWQPPAFRMGHYELGRKGFPVGCDDDTEVSFGELHISFHPTMLLPARTCFLPVQDETVARALETQVSRVGGVLPSTVTLYFVIQGPAPRIGPQTLFATLTHVTWRVFPFDLRPGGEPIATFDIDVPQPLAQ